MSKSVKGVPTINAQPQTSTSVWKLIERDYTLRLSLVAHEWATEHLRAWNAVFAEARKRGNSAYSGPALVEMEIADADKRAEWSYRNCCEIWEIQGHAKSRPFFRAVFDSCLQTIFSARESSFMSQLGLHQKRTALRLPQGFPAIAGSLRREMRRLRAKWNTRLEIAARDNEYRQQRSYAHELRQVDARAGQVPASSSSDTRSVSENPAAEKRLQFHGERMPLEQVSAIALTFTWKELGDRFLALHAKTKGRRFSATVIWTEWDSGATTEDWVLGGSQGLRMEFEHLASIAVRKLGYALKEGADTFWLNRVREWVQGVGLDKDKDFAWCPPGSVNEYGETGRTRSLETERIVELSAIFCVGLVANGTPESAVSTPPGHPKTADSEARSTRSKRNTKKTRTESRKTAVIFGAIQLRLKGAKYCAALDSRKVRLPDRWLEEGCPDTYAKAYLEPAWRKRIQDEKCRYGEQYHQTPAREREAIIQS